MSAEHKLEYDPELGDLTGPDFTGMSGDEIIEFWRSTTIAQRLHEAERLRRIKWGRKAIEPMKKILRVEKIK